MPAPKGLPVKAAYNTGSASKTSCSGSKRVRVRAFLLTVDDAGKVRDLTFPTYLATFAFLADRYDLDDNAFDDLCLCGFTYYGNYMIRIEEVMP